MTETVAEAAAVMTAAEKVAAKTICLVLKVGSFGNSKKGSLATVSVDADKALLRLSKTLIDSPELDAVKQLDALRVAQIRKMAFNSMFKGGVYQLPLAMVPTVNGVLESYIAERKPLVTAAVAAYAKRVEETTNRLGVQANVADYPSADRFAKSFYVEYSYVTFDTPARLKAISAELFAQEKDKASAKLSAVADEMANTMRAGLQELVNGLAERLTPDADGKKKRLAKTTVANLNEFLAMFDMKNVTDDAELAALVAKARAVMSGVDAKLLKDDDLIRQKVAATMAELGANLDVMVVDRSERDITFGDEDGGL